MNMLAKTKGRTLVEYSHLVFPFLQSGELKGRKIGALVENGITYLVSSGKAIKNTKVER